ncbi:39S ribosomal protein L2, mitochondrial isoform X1 [Oenanthe melanoleuca]|uniref:39S ribosomal protein L2, mitochondrial isoform X1 n=1 Tax=Oenanthe melanoleuca TaxID=2939378 RepID=UPI0024C11525|nr:39S ribosomal protein L2, mitochondrial isoform X1 [Oenanthe melanoleuca]
MAALGLCRAFGALLLSAGPRRARPPALPQPCLLGPVSVSALAACRGLGGSAPRCTTDPLWKCRTKYTVRPVGMKKTGGRDHTGRIRVRGIGGGHKRRYRMIDFQRLRSEKGAPLEPFTEKVISVRYDPCRSADIALVAGGNRKRWIIATENMQPGDSITSSPHIGRMAVSASEGDAYPLGALPVGTLICNLESHPGKGAQYIRAAGFCCSRQLPSLLPAPGTCGVLLRKVNGTAIVQLPSKRHMQVLETCVATVGRVSNVDHNKRVIGKAGRNRWLGKRPHTGLWHRKGGWAGRKIKPLPPMKSYVNLPRVKAVE